MPAARYLAGVVVLAGVYYAAGRASLALQFEGPVAAIWLPVGVGAATLYLAGLRWWPGLLLGDLALADTAQPLGTALGLTAGNMADIVIIAVLLRRLLGRRAALDDLAQVGGLLVAIVAGAATTATVGTSSMLLGDVLAGPDAVPFWRSWFLADASGALVVIPLALAWAQPRSAMWRGRRLVEATIIIASVVVLSVVALSGEFPLVYAVFPALIWAALRLGQRGATLAVVIASGTAVGITAAEVGPFVAQSLTDTDTALITQLYMGVAALTTLCLAAVVSERRRAVLELADARDRILAASDAERQRIERKLHDGAQQRLVVLRLRAALANDALERDPAAARRIIGELGTDVETVIAEVRSLATTIYPTTLADFGLPEALRSLARTAPVATRVEIDGVERCRPAVEAAVYFCCAEALDNVAQHAGAATNVVISLSRHRHLRFEVRDDGPGFAASEVPAGQGLENMRDRIDAVGGTLDVRSAPGDGTSIIGTIPNAQAAREVSDEPSERRSRTAPSPTETAPPR